MGCDEGRGTGVTRRTVGGERGRGDRGYWSSGDWERTDEVGNRSSNWGGRTVKSPMGMAMYSDEGEPTGDEMAVGA